MFNETTFKALETTSAKIRYAASFGLTRSQIVKLFETVLGRTIRYQHVRNVLLQVPKKEIKQPVEKMTEADIM